MLVDFKGGATFLGLERAPHVAAVISKNLADEAHLVARIDALAGRGTGGGAAQGGGNFVNVADYERARLGAGLAPMPALFVVVDEFSELLHQHPDFAELFVAIGRLGRSLGIHLLLASQRLDEGRLRGLETHLSYRICLKTFSANESRAVLGVADAHHLPSAPGAAYLKTSSAELLRFQAAFVSWGVCRPRPVDDQAPNRDLHGLHRRGDRPCHIGARTLGWTRSHRPARCSTPSWTDWPAMAHRRIACGCRRWRSRPPWTP